MANPAQPSESTSTAGDAGWFAREVHSHDSAVKAYLRGAFPTVADVEDIVQESYLRVWRLRAGAPIRCAKALLFTIARRLALDNLRHHRASPFVPVKDIDRLFVLDGAPNAVDAAVCAQDIEFLVRAIETLPGRCREIFILCHLEGLTQREVAGRLGLSENTVAVQSSRGLLRCEACFRRWKGWR